MKKFLRTLLCILLCIAMLPSAIIGGVIIGLCSLLFFIVNIPAMAIDDIFTAYL